MKFQSTAQAGQDAFTYEVTGHRKSGTFLDIGSHNVVVCNNSVSLEQVGWRGLMVDLHRDDENLHRRTSPFIHGDARHVNWLDAIATAGLDTHITYLSLDCDGATLEVMGNLPLHELKFDVVTVEHDAYANGPEPRAIINECFKGYGYDLVCDNVKICIPGYNIDGPFESWFVAPHLSQNAERFRCTDKYWQEILEGCL